MDRPLGNGIDPRTKPQQTFCHALAQSRSRTYRLPMLEPGSPAPDFSVSDDEGNTRTLKDFAGKTLVLWFYPKADTPG